MSGTQLTIHISRTSVHIAEVLRSNNSLIRIAHTELHESSPDKYKSVIRDFIEKEGFDKEYEEVTAGWSAAKHALTPLRVYNESNPQAIFSLLFGESTDHRTLDFNRLMELNMVCVFEIPDWVKSLFVLKYPRISIKHEHALFLRALFQSSSFHRAMHISMNDDYFNLDIVYHNELIFANSFQYQTAEDVLYYALNTLDKQELKQQKVELHSYFLNDKQKGVIDSFYDLLGKVSGHQLISKDPINSLTLQPLCV